MNEKKILARLYPSVVTVRGDWKKMVNEVKDLKLKTISLFLTGAKYQERLEIYSALEKTAVKNIPHVHLRHDAKEAEIDYLVKRYHAKAFTIHYPAIKNFIKSKYKKQIFIENNWQTYSHDIFPKIKDFGGLCIDLSHLTIWEETKPGNLPTTRYAVEKYKVGCNHISAIKANGTCEHYLKNLSEVDYLTEIRPKYFSQYLNLELGNTIKEQIIIIKYIAKILAKTWK